MKTRAGGETPASCAEVQTSWGVIRIAAHEARITSCVLPRLSAEPHKPFRWQKSRVIASNPGDRRALEHALKFVRGAFRGKPGRAPEFAWPQATPFTLRVWRALAAIAPGTTLEYGALARRIGRAGGSRAVGRACGANPLPLFIPCHRVLPKDGSLGGFACGLPWKRLLLEQERSA
jgi:O-6-methylguanine DNA methyltransferase